jgi:hypothetical protein
VPYDLDPVTSDDDDEDFFRAERELQQQAQERKDSQFRAKEYGRFRHEKGLTIPQALCAAGL